MICKVSFGPSSPGIPEKVAVKKKKEKKAFVKRYVFQTNAINFECSKFALINVTLEFDALR